MSVRESLVKRAELRDRLLVRSLGDLGHAGLSLLDRLTGFFELLLLVKISGPRKQRSESKNLSALLSRGRGNSWDNWQSGGNYCRENNYATKHHCHRSTPDDHPSMIRLV